MVHLGSGGGGAPALRALLKQLLTRSNHRYGKRNLDLDLEEILNFSPPKPALQGTRRLGDRGTRRPRGGRKLSAGGAARRVSDKRLGVLLSFSNSFRLSSLVRKKNSRCELKFIAFYPFLFTHKFESGFY